MTSRFYKEREGDTCPVEWEFDGPCMVPVGINADQEFPSKVTKKMCEDCPFRSTMWITKDGAITIRCNAHSELEDTNAEEVG